MIDAAHFAVEVIIPIRQDERARIARWLHTEEAHALVNRHMLATAKGQEEEHTLWQVLAEAIEKGSHDYPLAGAEAQSGFTHDFVGQLAEDHVASLGPLLVLDFDPDGKGVTLAVPAAQVTTVRADHTPTGVVVWVSYAVAGVRKEARATATYAKVLGAWVRALLAPGPISLSPSGAMTASGRLNPNE